MRDRFVSLAKTILPWVITVILLAIVFHKIHFHEAFERFKGADLSLFLPVAITFNVYVMFVNAYVYTKVLNWFVGKIDYKTVLSVRGASFLLTSVNPGAGQGGLFYLLSRRSGLELKKVLSAALVVPVADIAFVACLLFVPLVVHEAIGGVVPDAQVWILFAVTALAIVLVALHLWFWFFSSEDFGKKLKDSVWATAFRKARPVDYLKILGMRCFQHIPGIMAFWLVLRAFHGYVPIPTFVARFLPALLISALPITVGQMGTSQVGWTLMYGDLVEHDILIAFTLSWYFIYSLSRVVIGAIFFRGEMKTFMKSAKKTGPIKEATNG